ncbi:MAG: undecaprenyldiphospho-muramoylpentapeptide beta-N-acetylglucosaminyltransferase [Hyphomicrobiaceae bacterium]
MGVTTKTILLAAGGTGGHLFPAFALGEELGRRGYIVDLVTDMRGDRYGSDFPAREIYQVPAATLGGGGRKVGKVVKTAATLTKGTTAAYRLLKRVRPDAVVGFGGYPTFPPLVAAKMRAIPTALHEQNAVLGRANRMLAGRVTAIATSFEQTKYLSEKLSQKVVVTGNPVRDRVIAAAQTPFDPPTGDKPFKLIVFGGSQGARYFSDTVPTALAAMPLEIRQRIQIVQQCREEDLERVKKAYATIGVVAQLATFFADLPQLIAESHLVVGRAGASSIAELTVIGRPSILVPLPHALDNDQLNNARQLAESGGAWCIEQKDLSAERLADEIVALATSGDRLVAAADAARRQGRPDAVARFGDLVVKLAEKDSIGEI